MRSSIIALAIVAVLVAACTPAETTNRDRTTAFIGGNAGVNVGLLNGVPPAAVYDGGRMDFSVGVALDNVGEADIGPTTRNPFVRIGLEGFVPGVFGLAPAEMSHSIDRPLMGAHKILDGSVLPGQTMSVLFEGLNYQERLQGNQVYTFLVNACYDYENFATVPICFKDDIIENVEDAQVCTLTGEKLPQNSGGPIHISSLVQNPLAPHKVMINFVVEHVGTGDFYGRTANEVCDPSLTNMNLNKVELEVTSESTNMQIQCSQLGGDNVGVMALYNGAPMTVTCTLTNPDPGSRIYTQLVTVNSRYRYGETIAQPVLIQAVGGQ